MKRNQVGAPSILDQKPDELSAIEEESESERSSQKSKVEESERSAESLSRGLRLKCACKDNTEVSERDIALNKRAM